MRTYSLERAGRTQATGREESQGGSYQSSRLSPRSASSAYSLLLRVRRKGGDTFPSLSLAHVTSQHITPCTAQAHDRQCGLPTLENENPQKTAEMDVVNDGNYWVSGEMMP